MQDPETSLRYPTGQEVERIGPREHHVRTAIPLDPRDGHLEELPRAFDPQEPDPRSDGRFFAQEHPLAGSQLHLDGVDGDRKDVTPDERRHTVPKIEHPSTGDLIGRHPVRSD
jgi:hypothetical protein